MKSEAIFGLGAIAIVGAGVALGFAAIGSPAHARSVQFDERRSEELSWIVNAINARYNEFELPAVLPGDLRTVDGTLDELHDPETGAAYRYERLGPRAYRLCAVFDTASAGDPGGLPAATHGAGLSCFRYELAPHD